MIKDSEELLEKMWMLIDEREKSENTGVLFNETAKSIIKEISDYAKTTELFKEGIGKAEEFFKEERYKDAQSLYILLLNRILNSPTFIHQVASIILLMPYIDELVNV